jgi:hypothetical protein
VTDAGGKKSKLLFELPIIGRGCQPLPDSQKLLINEKLLQMFHGPGDGYLEKSPLAAGGTKLNFLWL